MTEDRSQRTDEIHPPAAETVFFAWLQNEGRRTSADDDVSQSHKQRLENWLCRVRQAEQKQR
jgi:hypothetical protein